MKRSFDVSATCLLSPPQLRLVNTCLQTCLLFRPQLRVANTRRRTAMSSLLLRFLVVPIIGDAPFGMSKPLEAWLLAAARAPV